MTLVGSNNAVDTKGGLVKKWSVPQCTHCPRSRTAAGHETVNQLTPDVRHVGKHNQRKVPGVGNKQDDGGKDRDTREHDQRTTGTQGPLYEHVLRHEPLNEKLPLDRDPWDWRVMVEGVDNKHEQAQQTRTLAMDGAVVNQRCVEHQSQ